MAEKTDATMGDRFWDYYNVVDEATWGYQNPFACLLRRLHLPHLLNSETSVKENPWQGRGIDSY